MTSSRSRSCRRGARAVPRRCPPPGSSTPTRSRSRWSPTRPTPWCRPRAPSGSGSSAGWPCSTPRGCGRGTPTPTGALARVVAAAADDPDTAVALLQELHAVPIDTALLTEALKRVREAGVTVAARVSPQRARELAPDLLAAGVEVLVVQGTIISAEHVSARRAAQPQGLHRLARRAGGRGGLRRLPHRHAPHAHRRGGRDRRVRAVGRHHHRRGARHRGAHGHRDRRRRRRPPRLPRRDRRPLRPRHRRRRHPQLRRRRQGHRLRRGRRDAGRAARRRLRRPRLRRLLDLGGGAPVAAALGGRAGARRSRGTWSGCSSARRAAPSARSTSSARCGGRWRRPATRT